MPSPEAEEGFDEDDERQQTDHGDAGAGIGENPSGVVAGIGGDQSRSQDRPHRRHPAGPFNSVGEPSGLGRPTRHDGGVTRDLPVARGFGVGDAGLQPDLFAERSVDLETCWRDVRMLRPSASSIT
jgi:hypothetical protein